MPLLEYSRSWNLNTIAIALIKFVQVQPWRYYGWYWLWSYIVLLTVLKLCIKMLYIQSYVLSICGRRIANRVNNNDGSKYYSLHQFYATLRSWYIWSRYMYTAMVMVLDDLDRSRGRSGASRIGHAMLQCMVDESSFRNLNIIVWTLAFYYHSSIKKCMRNVDMQSVFRQIQKK